MLGGLYTVSTKDSYFSVPSAPAPLNQCSRASPDARPQRRVGRAEERDPVCALTLRQEAEQDRHPLAGQELHPDAGQRAGGDEEAGVVLVARGGGAHTMPPCDSSCTSASGPSEGARTGRRSERHPASPSLPVGIPPSILSAILFLPPLLLAITYYTTHQQVTSRHIISQNRCEGEFECFTKQHFFRIFLAKCTKG